MVLVENMYHIISNSDADIAEYGIASAGLPVHMAHIGLLVDTLCNGTSIATILGASAIQGGRGVVAKKGSSSIPREGGGFDNYSDVLTIASYETAHRVLFDACPMGLIDRIETAKAVQITGAFEKVGYEGRPHRSKGERLALINDLIQAKEERRRAEGGLASIAFEEYGVTYDEIVADMMAGSSEIPRSRYRELLERDDMKELFDEIRRAGAELEAISEKLGIL